MDLTHVIDWSREALQDVLAAGRAAAGGGPGRRAGDQRAPDADPVARAGRGAGAAPGRGLLVLLAILPWLVGRWVSFAVDLISAIPDLL